MNTKQRSEKQSTLSSYFYFWRKLRKNRSHFRHYNLVKFYLISTILDILVKVKYKEHLDSVPYSYISGKLHNECAIPEFMAKISYDECIDIVIQMEWMLLIEVDFDNNESIILTDEGLRMYETQHFHSIYSSLLEAHSSRILSKNALIFAGISAIIAIISLILSR